MKEQFVYMFWQKNHCLVILSKPLQGARAAEPELELEISIHGSQRAVNWAPNQLPNQLQS